MRIANINAYQELVDAFNHNMMVIYKVVKKDERKLKKTRSLVVIGGIALALHIELRFAEQNRKISELEKEIEELKEGELKWDD